MSGILVRPYVLREKATELREEIVRIEDAFKAFDSSYQLLGPAWDDQGTESSSQREKYYRTREIIKNKLRLISSFADELNDVADAFEKADRAI